MLTVEEAAAAVLARARPLPPRALGLDAAAGRVLAEDVAADLDAPPFDKALVDGYAVRASDLAAGDGWLTVGETVHAGQTPTRPLGPGEAALVMTGAPLPAGADAVVMVERSRRDGPRVAFDGAPVTAGQNRLLRGREMRAGQTVLQAGTVLNPARLGVLASVGRTSVQVVPAPRVAVLSTGDELVEPGQVPGPGQIRNSNATTLRALAAAAGGLPEVLPTAPDLVEPLRQALSEGLLADALLITGGVSAGNRDLVPDSLAALGVERVFHKIRLKPGKPLWFGVGPGRPDGSPGPLVFGLPGNPVSGIVGFLLFVRPALRVLARLPPRPAVGDERPLAVASTHSGDRPTYHPARLRDDGSVEPLNWAGSADLRTVGQADGFAAFPAGDRAYAAGEIVRFLPLG